MNYKLINETFNILVLDGGGSKGVYTIGFLKELEKFLGYGLSNHFDLIYGTSTGSIIAALIATGKTLDEIDELYKDFVPKILTKKGAAKKSKALQKYGEEIFDGFTFSNLKTDVGLVALNNLTKEPFIFKSNISQAHGMYHSFEPGFGCSLIEAVQSSCAAYPLFKKVCLNTLNYGNVELVDGGFVANNATLYAIVDAIKAFKVPKSKLKILSVGTGQYLEKSTGVVEDVLTWIPASRFFTQVFTASTNTNAKLTELVFPDIEILRINETNVNIRTNMLESNSQVLDRINQFGSKSFARNEKIINLFINKRFK